MISALGFARGAVYLTCVLSVLAAGPSAAADETPAGEAEIVVHDLLRDANFLRPASFYRPADRRSGDLSLDRASLGPWLAADDTLNDDRFEWINRQAHEFNGFLRRHLLEPVTEAYLQVASRPVQKGISNVFANLREPMTIASNLLLGDTQGATHATTRFVINTTAGLGGFYDQAAEDGYARRPRVLEEVLCRYGAPAGPYVVLPVLGPATVRDAAGKITTLFIQYVVLGPVYIPYRLSDIVVQYVELREQLRFIESNAIDPYSAQRSAHMQIHNRLACDGQAVHIELFGQ
jgi:phospholipid-binding lipoprotein MlaA